MVVARSGGGVEVNGTHVLSDWVPFNTIIYRMGFLHSMYGSATPISDFTWNIWSTSYRCCCMHSGHPTWSRDCNTYPAGYRPARITPPKWSPLLQWHGYEYHTNESPSFRPAPNPLIPVHLLLCTLVLVGAVAGFAAAAEVAVSVSGGEGPWWILVVLSAAVGFGGALALAEMVKILMEMWDLSGMEEVTFWSTGSVLISAGAGPQGGLEG